MKTTVIQLEPHDDLVSIKDKMSWNPSPRMILVWPKRGKLLKGTLDLSLIQRAAKRYGAQLALVTHDLLIKENAQALKIPFFSSISKAERKSWTNIENARTETKFPKGFSALLESKEKTQGTEKIKEQSVLIKIVTMVISILAMAALFFFTVPSATITLHPQKSIQEAELEIIASPIFSGFNPSGGLPAFAQSVEVSGELSRKSTGTVRVPTIKASGLVTFTNLTQTQVTIPAESVLITEDPEVVKFITLEELVLPAEKNAIIVGKVEAMKPGEEGNIDSGKISSIAGGIGTIVSVNNSEAFVGGKGVDASAPSESDYSQLKIQLLEELKDRSITTLYSNLEVGRVLIVESVLVEEVLSNERVNVVDLPSDEATLRLTVRYKALTYKEEDQNSIATVVLDGNLQSGFMAFNDSMIVKKVGVIKIDNKGQAIWTMKASREIMPEWNRYEIANALAGKTKETAFQTLQKVFPQTEPAEISLNFKWWKWMPFLPTQIHFSMAGTE